MIWQNPVKPKHIEYTVKAGDTLSAIAHKYHTTTKAIKQKNHLPSDNIRIKQKLKI